MKQNLLIGIVAVVALAAGLYFSVVIAPPEVEEVKYLQKYPVERALPEFELYDQNGEVFNNQQLKGYWTLAFVGYTFCPDICPTTLAELKGIYPQLQAIKTENPVKIWFLSVDPKRDSAERLQEYVNFFNPDFWATSGEHKQLFPLVRAMGMMYAMSDNTDDPNYLVDHSASITVINPRGEVVGRFKPKMEPGSIPVSEGSQILEDMPKIVTMM
ncbi:SCO family protein [Aliiglaciecola sp. 2_MG-2023]|uniref:SCO family protein n=1 Tax=unclassified Aliiglaciecola TaxID=2593648 RepID=UPI0026E2F24B|nr:MULTISPECIES: SCO family protein [unclassified Aliiglaciecola]MDO6711075.1 SCO family protein [Aliiglaciecola sp. 2_MG-2023]MDO6751989.1 SCO family protein [Aliiglaciecola sp. 1_MG-2023]